MYRESNWSQVNIITLVWPLFVINYVVVPQLIIANSRKRELAKEIFNYVSFSFPKTDSTARTKTLNP